MLSPEIPGFHSLPRCSKEELENDIMEAHLQEFKRVFYEENRQDPTDAETLALCTFSIYLHRYGSTV